ncbi:YolD-like protein [Paenibacillus sp. S25]|nr:YolD-like protein [Paenibacillus sp. S25]
MGKKLEGNGLWESSWIIIPEHKEAYLKLMKDRQRRGKPELDDQEVQLIEQALIVSYNTRQPISWFLARSMTKHSQV